MTSRFYSQEMREAAQLLAVKIRPWLLYSDIGLSPLPSL